MTLPALIRWVLSWPWKARLAAYTACIVGVLVSAWPVDGKDLRVAFFAWLGGIFFIGTFVERVPVSVETPDWRRARRLIPWAALVIVAVFLVARSQQQSERTEDLAKTIQSGLIDSCQSNGNPQREVIRAILQEAIENDQTAVPKLFPQVPPALIDASVKAKRRQKARVPNIDCVTQYSGRR